MWNNWYLASTDFLAFSSLYNVNDSKKENGQFQNKLRRNDGKYLTLYCGNSAGTSNLSDFLLDFEKKILQIIKTINSSFLTFNIYINDKNINVESKVGNFFNQPMGKISLELFHETSKVLLYNKFVYVPLR